MNQPPPPDAAGLREAALTYLARYAATRESLRRVLLRRIDRWAAGLADQEAAADLVATSRALVDGVVARLVDQGAVDDAVYAEGRGLGLMRAGVSRRAAIARLVGKGVDPGQAADRLPPDEDTELAAALVLTRKRRIGAFRTGDEPDAVGRRREYGILARAGFPAGIARQALAMDAEEAEARIRALRQ